MSGARTGREWPAVGAFAFVVVTLGALTVMPAILLHRLAGRQRRLRRQLRSALDEANRQRAIAERRGTELERATEGRARLLRGVSHDVKNPLGAARGYADLLQMEVKAPLAPEQRPLVDGIQRSIDSALAILTDLLDLARADSGGLSIHRIEADLVAMAGTAAEDHRSAAEAAGHDLEIERPPEPLRVFTDPARVSQILGNVLSNAIMYTPAPGRITVRSGLESDERGGARAAVRVTDTGPGIPPEQREAVFHEFTRLQDAGPQKGHGLGLAIARRIARVLGGDLTVEDGPTSGATFVLHLPVRREDDPPGR